MVIIPGQQFGSMEVGLAKEGLCLREGLGSHNQQLLHEPIAFEITAQVNGRLAPGADRQDRNVDSVEFTEGRTEALPFVVGRMGIHVLSVLREPR